jgi:adenylyl cyclase-associated protein
MLVIASNSKKPSDDQIQKLLQPTSDLMQKIVAIKDSNRANKFFNNLSAVAEGVPALSWVVVVFILSPISEQSTGSYSGSFCC